MAWSLVKEKKTMDLCEFSMFNAGIICEILSFVCEMDFIFSY